VLRGIGVTRTRLCSSHEGAFEHEPEIELPDAAPELRERDDDDRP
jgi:hypothetical protein